MTAKSKKVREDIEVRARALHQQSKTTEPFSIPMTVSSKNLKLHSYTTLDKLQQYIGGSNTVQVEGVIKGNDIFIANAKTKFNRRRTS